MSEPKPNAETLRRVQACRISTKAAGAESVEEDLAVAVEAAITIDVDRVDTYSLLCTPADTRALAVGFLHSEGIIDRLDEIASIQPCVDDPTIVRVKLRSAGAPRIDDEGRNLLIVSSCGLCGAENLADKLAALPAVANTLRLERPLLRITGSVLHDQQQLFQATGGTQAAGIFDERGKLLSWAEDVGRHNALDKAIGKCLLEAVPVAGRAVVLSGRASLEMIGKCARAGIELISAVSAPTSLAIEVADRCNITLCAFVRETRATVFTHPSRVVAPASVIN